MNALEEVFAQTMPSGMGYDYSGMSYQEKQAQKGITIGMIFAASAVFVFLILASLYESWSLPVAVFMTAPIAILGAFLALWITGLDLNIYSEIGLIVLIALAAKTPSSSWNSPCWNSGRERTCSRPPWMRPDLRAPS